MAAPVPSSIPNGTTHKALSGAAKPGTQATRSDADVVAPRRAAAESARRSRSRGTRPLVGGAACHGVIEIGRVEDGHRVERREAFLPQPAAQHLDDPRAQRPASSRRR